MSRLRNPVYGLGMAPVGRYFPFSLQPRSPVRRVLQEGLRPPTADLKDCLGMAARLDTGQAGTDTITDILTDPHPRPRVRFNGMLCSLGGRLCRHRAATALRLLLRNEQRGSASGRNEGVHLGDGLERIQGGRGPGVCLGPVCPLRWCPAQPRAGHGRRPRPPVPLPCTHGNRVHTQCVLERARRPPRSANDSRSSCIECRAK